MRQPGPEMEWVEREGGGHADYLQQNKKRAGTSQDITGQGRRGEEIYQFIPCSACPRDGPSGRGAQVAASPT